MPEDTRVQQQVHVHIWMEADIIRVIVSDARRAVKVTLDVLGRKFWMLKIQKIHGSRRAASARGGCRTKGYSAARCHQAREHHTLLTRNLHSLHRKSGLDLPCPDTYLWLHELARSLSRPGPRCLWHRFCYAARGSEFAGSCGPGAAGAGPTVSSWGG